MDNVLKYLLQFKKSQNLQFGFTALVAIMVIVSFFIVKSSIGKIAEPDRSHIEEMQREREAIQKEREALAADRVQVNKLITEVLKRDSLQTETYNRMNQNLGFINSQLKSLNDGYKNLSSSVKYSSDEHRKFFASLKTLYLHPE